MYVLYCMYIKGPFRHYSVSVILCITMYEVRRKNAIIYWKCRNTNTCRSAPKVKCSIIFDTLHKIQHVWV